MKPLFTLLLAGVVAIAGASAAAPNADGKQRLVFLSDKGPIVIELNVLIDGKPFRAAHAAFLDELFKALDRDKDGVLSKKEAAGAPSPQVLAGPGGFGGVRVSGKGRQLGDKVTPKDLAAYYTKNGLPPFSLSFTPKQDGVIVLNNLGKDDASADAINARLFELLDTDKDGKLSKKELRAAATILGRLDDDEDEMLTSAELQGRAAPRGSDDEVELVVVSGATAPAPADRPLYAVGADGVTPDLGKRLLTRYGKKGAKSLTREQIGLPAGAFERLDRDEDDQLDADELARVGTLPPAASFTVRLGKRAGKEPIVEAGQANEWVRVTPSGGGALLEVGKIQLELRGPKEEDFKVNVNFSVREQYINQFRMADKDNNGYLDREEAKGSPLLSNLFAAMDEDGDGQLFEKEMLAYVDRVEGLRKRASQSCLTLSVRDDGKGLFELLDLDGDGRLSVRELRQAARLLDKLDADKDGHLAKAEVPKRYKGSFDLGSSSGGNGGRNVVVFRAGMEAPTGPAAKTKGPLWFRKMDRNRDGDVSLKEWLGTEDEFRAADADGDGLISAAEAERYDKRKRATEE
ncbi:MAG: EF-hand domain-containing protein [Gemmataceae bacterium]